jgi:hypothetical protein
MPVIAVRVPNSLYEKVKDLIAHGETSVNHFLVSAVSEKIAAVMTLEYLRAAAARGERKWFEHFLSLVPTGKLIADDEIAS